MKSQLIWVFRAVLLGLVIGPACYLLSFLVGWSQNVRSGNWWLVFLLPVSALIITYSYNKVDPHLKETPGTTMDLINWTIRQRTNPSGNPQDPQKKVSPILAPMILVSTFLSHLSGASIGKEGAGVQIGTSISSLCAKLFHSREDEMGTYLVIGSGAAFGALFKAPIAGTLFGIMVASPNIARFDAMVPCLIGSLVASGLSTALGIETPEILNVLSIGFTFENILYSLLLGVIAGVMARVFFLSNKATRNLFSKVFPRQYVRITVSSCVLLVSYLIIWLITSDTEFCGLSTSLMNDSKWWAFLIKMVLTSLALASGFTGGEVVPTMVIGAALFRTLGVIIPIPVSTLAVFGAIGMLSGTTNLPLVCFALGLELFGMQNAEFLFIICVVAFVVSGRDSIYPHQLNHNMT